MGNKWPTLPLEELVENIFDRRGVTPTKLGSDFISAGHRVISAKLIKGSRIDLSADEPRFVNAATYKKWMSSPLQEEDVIMTSEAPLGELAWVRQKLEWCLGQRLFGIRTDKHKLNGRFLFYALQSETVRNDLISRATGTTVTGIRQSELRKVVIPLPPLPEQKRIAGILGALDDKIELNRKMNETLEQMANALFKSWFVDFDPVHAKAVGRQPAGMDKATSNLFPDSFVDSESGKIPRGWKVLSLDEIAHFLNGLALQKYPPSDGPTLPVIKIAQLRKGNTTASDRCDASLPSEFVIKDGDVLFSWSGSLEVEIWCGGKGALNQHLFKVTSTEFPKWFYYLWTRWHLEEFRRIAAYKATTMGHIQRGHLTAAKVITAPNELLGGMTEIIAPIINRIEANKRQTRTLCELRDNLLPRLLSGEISAKIA